MAVPRCRVRPGRYVVARLAVDAAVPAWATGDLVSITRADDELSVVCDGAAVPAGITAEGPWAAITVAGPLDFALVGVLRRLLDPLAEAGVPVFAVSTHDTDHVLVPAARLDAAVAALRAAGVTVDDA